MQHLRVLALPVLCLALFVASHLQAGDLGDDPAAMSKAPEYVSAVKKLAGDLKQLPDYVEAMKSVHAKFHGTPGTFACFGDSITAVREFWMPLKDGAKNMNPQMKSAYELVQSYMKPECWSWKGSQNGNNGGEISLWGRDNVEKWLQKLKPEVAVILFGSNDMDRGGMSRDQALKEYEQAMTEMIKKCLDNGTVVILTTIPPRRTRRCDLYSEKVLKLAATFKLPVCDFLGECIQRRPEDWDGSRPKFQAMNLPKFEVPTLISGDGEHLSHPKAFDGDYSDEALKISGNNLRNYLTLLSYADVLRKVCGVPEPKGAKN